MSDLILAIDPGTERSGWALMYSGEIIQHGININGDLLGIINDIRCDEAKLRPRMAIEMVACYGMAVGRDVFETCVWVGRFGQQWRNNCRKVYRREVKHLLCNSSKATDANVRQAIIDRYPATGRNGKGKPSTIGTKAKGKGPLYGISSHGWAAIGVGIVAAEKWDELEQF